MVAREIVIERMARAIYNAYVFDEVPFLSWEILASWSKDVARRQARAALEVMQQIADEENIT